jgi:hypothetical protein
MTTPYFYIIEHKESGKRYAGSRWAKNCHPSEFMTEDGYTTSSADINKIIESEGLNAFKIVELTEMEDPYGYETKFLHKNQCAQSDQWFNYHNNVNRPPPYGSAEYSKMMLDRYGVEHAVHIRTTCEHCNKEVSLPIYARYHGDLCKVVNPNRVVNTHLIGKPKSEQCKINQGGVEHYDPLTLQTKRIKLHLGEKVPEGWKKGRPANNKYIWITDGSINKRVDSSLEIPNGFRKGRTMNKDHNGKFVQRVSEA